MSQQDKDFEAAILQLRQGNNKNLIKFGALMILLLIGFFLVVALTSTISSLIN